MAWTDLKGAVASVIKTNGNQEITGGLLQSTLNSIIDQVGANASYKGVAIPSTAPGSPDGPVFYIASTQGTYANFGGFVLDGGFAVLSNVSGSWTGTKFLKTEMDAKVDKITDIEQVRSQTTNKVASSKLLDDELTALENAVDAMIVGGLGNSETKVINQKAITLQSIEAWSLSESFSISSPTFNVAGYISGGTITWPDGDVGSISNVTTGIHGITSVRYNRSEAGKYATVNIGYDGSGVVSNQTVVLTGF